VCWPAASIPQIVCSRVCRDKTSSSFYFEDLDDNDFHDHFDLDLDFVADDEDGLAWTIYMGQTVCPTYQPICCWAALSTSITCALVIMSSSYYCHCYHYIVLITFFILILLRYKVGSTRSKINFLVAPGAISLGKAYLSMSMCNMAACQCLETKSSRKVQKLTKNNPKDHQNCPEVLDDKIQ